MHECLISEKGFILILGYKLILSLTPIGTARLSTSYTYAKSWVFNLIISNIFIRRDNIRG
ncbi:hypothetical protein SAMN05216269_11713 [Flavobacterium xinjiangense]|uniref:Uncharacterized protein n=1 Tax=Flavobacterium xinjiangense TaxID=178356 RepID=A0A1M7PGR0_9FLAO|nr:hypothetical protein SAMN05216269_11713 [Flavobacterium xinjiangense]